MAKVMREIKKVLIANRGEIARRIIRTCKELGISTVAVYSEPDAEALFVGEADEAVLIGPAQAKKSYLNIDAIIQVALVTKCDAIHPGYGFLSENPAFARACEDHGIVFIGPSPAMIEAMGDKIRARKLMQQAGVPVVPGWDGHLASVEDALAAAEGIGYPLMLKASAGGGGIGMHKVFGAEELRRVFSATVQKAEAYFGNGTVFMEKWIESGRHIEVQVLMDEHGHGVHLFERECSVQRRHQKVVEESPSPLLTPDEREHLCETALRGAMEIGYTNAGTMEFIFDEAGNFYFLEMNTRLQVEHPITEETTGLNLVELQIALAAGQPLTMSQADIRQVGHALECRVYAEDPVTFFPSPGLITEMHLPDDLARLDFGVGQDSQVSPYYDPMIGKVITHAPSRSEAIDKMTHALAAAKVEGVKTNLPLLREVCGSDAFRTGNYNTSLLQHFKSTVSAKTP